MKAAQIIDSTRMAVSRSIGRHRAVEAAAAISLEGRVIGNRARPELIVIDPTAELFTIEPTLAVACARVSLAGGGK